MVQQTTSGFRPPRSPFLSQWLINVEDIIGVYVNSTNSLDELKDNIQR